GVQTCALPISLTEPVDPLRGGLPVVTHVDQPVDERIDALSCDFLAVDIHADHPINGVSEDRVTLGEGSGSGEEETTAKCSLRHYAGKYNYLPTKRRFHMVQRVGIVGAGLMGAGIAEVAAKSGADVLGCELKQEAMNDAQR